MLSISGCSRDKDKSKNIQSNNQTSNITPDSLRKKQFNTNLDKLNPTDYYGEVISPDKLSSFLPSSIPGSQKTKPSKGTRIIDDKKVTSTSSSFTFPKGGVTVQINDYGEIGNIPASDLKYFENPPKEPGFSSETIDLIEGKGFINWDESNSSGVLYFLLISRFIIKMDAYKLPKGVGGLNGILTKINYKSLLELAKKKK